MNTQLIVNWVNINPLTHEHIDCITTVMLKILDGKCKMKSDEKVVMSLLYEQVKHQPGKLLGDDIHALIASAKNSLDDAMRNHIYEKRVLAETCISRPVMKSFKAMIRQQGLFVPLQQEQNT